MKIRMDSNGMDISMDSNSIDGECIQTDTAKSTLDRATYYGQNNLSVSW